MTTKRVAIYKELPCVLCDEEIHERGLRLARLVEQIAEAEETKKDAAKEASAAIRGLRRTQEALADAVNSGLEVRRVRTTLIQDWGRGTVTQIREDTGEVFLERGMTPEERAHPALPLESPDDTTEPQAEGAPQ